MWRTWISDDFSATQYAGFAVQSVEISTQGDQMRPDSLPISVFNVCKYAVDPVNMS